MIWNEGNGTDWYGTFRMGEKLVKSHRAAYIIYVGDIPKGMHVCHTCDVKNCVNPEHLFVGSQSDNIRDMHAKGRWISGNYGNHLKLNQVLADHIRSDTRTHQQIADYYGVSRTTVSSIKNGKSWRT